MGHCLSSPHPTLPKAIGDVQGNGGGCHLAAPLLGYSISGIHRWCPWKGGVAQHPRPAQEMGRRGLEQFPQGVLGGQQEAGHV